MSEQQGGRSPKRRGSRRGISLIEVMVALTILSVVLIALGGLMFQVARQTQRSAAITYRTAAMQRAAAWIEGLPWDSIGPSPPPGIIGCTSDSSGLLAYNRCITVQDTTIQLKRIELVIAPTGILTARPETLVVYRNRPRAASPLR